MTTIALQHKDESKELSQKEKDLHFLQQLEEAKDEVPFIELPQEDQVVLKSKEELKLDKSVLY